LDTVLGRHFSKRIDLRARNIDCARIVLGIEIAAFGRARTDDSSEICTARISTNESFRQQNDLRALSRRLVNENRGLLQRSLVVEENGACLDASGDNDIFPHLHASDC
jgi:hypothetical protein